MGLCACAWRLTLEVSSMGAWGATAGDVKLLLPPRQSRGISFASLVCLSIAPWHAYVANDAADTSAWNEHALALRPDSVEFAQKRLVVLDSAKLALRARGYSLSVQ